MIRIVLKDSLGQVAPSPVTAVEPLVTQCQETANVRLERWANTVRMCVPMARGVSAAQRPALFVKMEEPVTNTMGRVTALLGSWANCVRTPAPLDTSVTAAR